MSSRTPWRQITTLLLLLLVAQLPFAKAQNSSARKPFELTIDNIMRGPELAGYPPSEVRWSGDSKRIYFRWRLANEKEPSTWVVDRTGGAPRKLTTAEEKTAPPANGEWNQQHRWRVTISDGDVVLIDTIAGVRRQVTETVEPESNAHFTKDEKSVSFTRANNLYVMSIETGKLEQLTDIRTEPAKRETKPSGSQQFLIDQQKELFDVVREREQKKKEAEAKRKAENPREPFHLSPRQSIAALQLSPDGHYVIASVIERADGARNTIVPDYMSASGYTEDIPGRTKVGDPQNKTRLAVIRVENGEVMWPDSGQDKREVSMFAPTWSDDGTKCFFVVRSADNKDRWILLLDTPTAKTTMLAHDRDEAWLGGPGAFTFGWMPDNQRIYFESERSGFAHLYWVSSTTGQIGQLTAGKFEVSSPVISRDKTQWHFTSSEVSPAERHFYSMPLEGGPRTKLTSMAGNNDATLSPDETAMANIYSYTNQPPELNVQELKDGAASRRITNSPSEEFLSFPWIDPPIVSIPARDGAQVPARLYTPEMLSRTLVKQTPVKRAKRPAVIFVHGAGYLQNVHKWWSSYYREYMFHHLLVMRGYVVLDIDYRGSAGYGRDWRTAIYRFMGGKDLDDQVDGAKYLVEKQNVDPTRIGVYGGSYGGFITLMAMFTSPDTFAAGAALRPVTDWAHYNHPYTSNILNLPHNDQQAYKKSSPIYHAAGLKGALLICHGVVDTNVNFQDTMRLVQKLIELRKENWEVAMYPVENHGFQEPSSWADEYERIFKLFETNLRLKADTAKKR